MQGGGSRIMRNKEISPRVLKLLSSRLCIPARTCLHPQDTPAAVDVQVTLDITAWGLAAGTLRACPPLLRAFLHLRTTPAPATTSCPV